MAEARDRYFVPYLTALLQRCAIKKAAEEATEMVVREDVKPEAVSRLRSDVLAFALAGALPEVSVRYSLHRYYRMCQKAVDIDRNLEQVRSALGDLEAQLSARRRWRLPRPSGTSPRRPRSRRSRATASTWRWSGSRSSSWWPTLPSW